MGLDPSNLPENLRRAMLRDPSIRQAAAIQRREAFPNPAPGDSITFFVEGKPEPGGSKSSFVPTNENGDPYRGFAAPGKKGRIIVNTVDANPHVKEWKKAVMRAARIHFTRAPHDGPVEWEFRFILTRPKAHYGSGRNAERLRDDAPSFPTGKPDCVKLCRGTEDALIGICYTDDSKVVNQTSSKRYGPIAGVEITIRAVTVINPGNTRPTQPELPIPPAPTLPPKEPEDDQFPL